MNLRDSMLAAAEDAPLAMSTVNVDRIIERERRASILRRAGAGTVALATAAVTVPVLLSGQGPPASTASTVDPPASAVTPSPAAPSPAAPSPADAVMLLTAADLTAAVPGYGGTAALGLGAPAGGPIYMYLRRNQASLDVLAGDPCTLPTGAVPGRRDAPTPEDRCTRVDQNGKTAWVRRWGYSPRLRPGTTPDTVVVEAFFPLRNGRIAVLTVSNTRLIEGSAAPTTPGPHGPRFAVADAAIAELVLGLGR